MGVGVALQGMWWARDCIWDLGNGAVPRKWKQCVDNVIDHVYKRP